MACPPGPPAPEAPAGWVEYPLFNCRFRVFVPPSRAELPKGPTWKACASPGPDLTACREMAVDWKTAGSNATGGPPEATIDAQGHVVLQFRNIYEDAVTGRIAGMALVAEVDGPVRQALFTTYQPTTATGIWLLPAGVAPGKSLWKILDWDSNPMRRSAIGGEDDLLAPGVLFPLDASRGGAWVGSRWAVEVLPGAYRVIDWDTGDEIATAWQGSDASIPRFIGDVLYFSYVAPTDSALWIWTRDGGPVKLHGYGDDPRRAVGGLGTDGVDMVWLEGEDPTGAPGVFASRSIYTAPFTTEPSELQPRRLRGWEGEQLDTIYPPTVGCGYAAFVNPVAWTLVIVRLQDGAGWSIRSPAGNTASWNLPLAITCTEVFAEAGLNIRRIPLASLPAPSP